MTLDPAAGKIGVTSGVGAAACPAGYGSPAAIMSGLNPGTCTGCSCQPGAVTCQTTLSSFESAAECADPAKTGTTVATWKTGEEGAQCTATPAWYSVGTDSPYGVAVTPFSAAASGCTPAGSPVPGAPSWTATLQFCAASAIGGGCGAGRACVPASPQASLCQSFDGAHTCPTGTQESDWYTGYTGSQSCGACACGTSTGASCANVRMTLGSDYTCSGAATVNSGGRVCFMTATGAPGPSITPG